MVNVNSANANSTASTTATLKISIPSKTGKKRSLLIDALRILAWKNFRSEYKEELKDLNSANANSTASTTATLKISIPSKTGKKRSLLIDALRIQGKRI